jgi:hypothetical protein
VELARASPRRGGLTRFEAMNSLACWVQRADFSTTDHGPLDVDTALWLFDRHPWREELNLQSELASQEREYCPPGIGFVDPGGPILHICPTADGLAVVHYHSALRTVRTREGISRADVIELIHHLFQGEQDWIVTKLDARP